MGIRLVLLIVVWGWLGTGTGAAAPWNCQRCHATCSQAGHDVGVAPLAHSCLDCHRGNPLTGRKELAHQRLIGARHAWFLLPDSAVMQRGQHLRDQNACRRCHLQDAQGNALATDLDSLLPQTLVAEVVAAIDFPAFFMPVFNFRPDDRDAIINQLFAGSHKLAGQRPQQPLVVHFEEGQPAQQHLFDKHCGRCHRVLTSHAGGLGHGTIAPNLSGLFSPFYPPTFKEGQRWQAAALGEWLKNPRKIRPLTIMPPQRISPAEVTALLHDTWLQTVTEVH